MLIVSPGETLSRALCGEDDRKIKPWVCQNGSDTCVPVCRRAPWDRSIATVPSDSSEPSQVSKHGSSNDKGATRMHSDRRETRTRTTDNYNLMCPSMNRAMNSRVSDDFHYLNNF